MHGRLCKNLGAAQPGQRQVVHVHRVFGANVATRHAITTVDAWPLHHALAVTSKDGTFPIEIDRDIEQLDFLPKLSRAVP